MYYDLLSQFIGFKSISTDLEFQSDISACAQWLLQLFSNHGFIVKKIEGYGNPIVYSHYHISDEFPTLLIYGHYDVQPANQNDGWQSDPFVLTQKEDRLIARGVVDNKWQIMIHIATAFELIESWDLAYNIKFLIEWDEETWWGDMDAVLHNHQELLHSDYALISDGEIIGNHTPTLVAGFRGWVNATLTLQTANTDVHSGIYGNILSSASHEAAKFIAQIYHNNRITIPWWYDDLQNIDPSIIENNKKIPYDVDILTQNLHIVRFIEDKEYDFATMVWLMPTIQVSGITSGYTWNGYNNIIPWSAIIKFNFRFWPGQNPKIKKDQFEKFIQDTIPDTVSRTFETSDPYSAIEVHTDNDFTRHVYELLEETYSKKPLYRYVGGAVPISGLLQDVLWVELVVADLGNEDCNMHGIHENFDLKCIEKWLEWSKKLLSTKIG